MLINKATPESKTSLRMVAFSHAPSGEEKEERKPNALRAARTLAFLLCHAVTANKKL